MNKLTNTKNINNFSSETFKWEQVQNEVKNKLGLEVHAGHGLTYKSTKILAKNKGITEFNIGHFLIGESIFIGLRKSINNFKKILKSK